MQETFPSPLPASLPVVAPRSAASDQTLALIRQILLVAGGALIVEPGYLSTPQLDSLVGGLLVAVPLIWGQIKVRKRAKQVATLVEFVPDVIGKRRGN